MTLDQTRPIADPNAATSPRQVELVGSVPTLPGVPMLVPVSAEELAGRRPLRARRP